MTVTRPHPGNKVVLQRAGLDRLIEVLRARSYQVLGPTVRDGAIVYDELASVDDLPAGWTDEQNGAQYRLKRREDQALFAYVVGPHSWKRYLHPPILCLWKATRANGKLKIHPEGRPAVQYAFIGVRACELHAIAIQDRVFRGGPFTDSDYDAHRKGVFIVAVNCGQAGGTCFCASMNTGPAVPSGHDLALTELSSNGKHRFLVEVGSARGAEVLAEVPHEPANRKDIQSAERIVADAARHMGREMDTRRIKDLLYRNYEHPRWESVASRCLTCANCTMVCPTCFCTTVEDVTDLTGQHAERWRKWDSCFNLDFSHLTGGSVRSTPMARYRQWMTHKLASWQDQFGTSGCVGCGRCITWCPVGIDITEEVRAIRGIESARDLGVPRKEMHDNHT